MSIVRLILCYFAVASWVLLGDVTTECDLGHEAVTTAQMSYRIETPEALRVST